MVPKLLHLNGAASVGFSKCISVLLSPEGSTCPAPVTPAGRTRGEVLPGHAGGSPRKGSGEDLEREGICKKGLLERATFTCSIQKEGAVVAFEWHRGEW